MLSIYFLLCVKPERAKFLFEVPAGLVSIHTCRLLKGDKLLNANCSDQPKIVGGEVREVLSKDACAAEGRAGEGAPAAIFTQNHPSSSSGWH